MGRKGSRKPSAGGGGGGDGEGSLRASRDGSAGGGGDEQPRRGRAGSFELDNDMPAPRGRGMSLELDRRRASLDSRGGERLSMSLARADQEGSGALGDEHPRRSLHEPRLSLSLPEHRPSLTVPGKKPPRTMAGPTVWTRIGRWFAGCWARQRPPIPIYDARRRAKRVRELKEECAIVEHKMSIEELCQATETSLERGLTSEEAAMRLARDGHNSLTPPAKTPLWLKFVHQMTTPFAFLLWFGSLLSWVAFAINPSDFTTLYVAVVLPLVIFVTGTLAFVQDVQSSNQNNKFKGFSPTFALVRRDGDVVKMDASLLVRGDVVTIESGQKVPADVRIVESTELRVDNSSLTGEPEPLLRVPECTHDSPMESKNIAFYGTLAKDGIGTGVVIQTGDRTMLGKIAGLVGSAKSGKTPIQKEITRFIIMVFIIALSLGAIFFVVALALGTDISLAIIYTIGIIVANVPEGLPLTVTASLTLTAKRLTARHVLVKNLPSVETLGCTTVICSDKTGTLTQNRMTAVHAWHSMGEVVSLHPPEFDAANVDFKALRRLAALCTDGFFSAEEYAEFLEGKRALFDVPIINGNASDAAIVKFAETVSPVPADHAANPGVYGIPFNSSNKFQVKIRKIQGERRLLLMIKGAPERVVARCTSFLRNGAEVPIDADFQARFQEIYDTLGGMGERVIGFAHLWLPESFGENFEFSQGSDASGKAEYNFPMDSFVFVGMLALIDPARESVPGAVAKCKSAGIKIIMVTGDHPITAAAIARKVGIITGTTVDEYAKQHNVAKYEITHNDCEAVVIPGSEIPAFSQEDWDRVLAFPEIVFARISPQQKLIIVENNQRLGHVCAMTGDGVNDAPALKQADIGVAMGISGTDVAKDSAAMILLDDNFSSIVNGVEEGRLIFDNLKKSIMYTLTHITPEILAFVVYIVLQVPLPLSTLLIFAIDLFTEMMPSTSLSYEPAESDIMRRPPRDTRKDRLVTLKLLALAYLQLGVIEAAAGFFAYIVVLGDYGVTPRSLVQVANNFLEPGKVIAGQSVAQRTAALAAAQSAFFLAIVICQIFNLVACKTRSRSVFRHGFFNNSVLMFAIPWALIWACIVIYVPGVTFIIESAPLKARYWAPAVPFGFLIFFYEEIRKFLVRHVRWFRRNMFY